MLIETQVVRSKSELQMELQGLPVTTAVIYRNVDHKAWEQIAKEHQGVRLVLATLQVSINTTFAYMQTVFFCLVANLFYPWR